MVYQAERPYPRHQIEAQRSGFILERRSHGAIWSFRGPYEYRGNGMNDMHSDEHH